MDDNDRALASNRQVGLARQVGYSVQMIADVVAGYDHALDRADMVLARCMLDAFYVHIRLLTEFLVRRTKSQDFGPQDFGIDWHPAAGPAADSLHHAWAIASTYVVHFGRARVPETIEELRTFEVKGSDFRRLATDALDVYSIFVVAVSDSLSDRVSNMTADERVEPRAAANLRRESKALQYLRTAEFAARAKLATPEH